MIIRAIEQSVRVGIAPGPNHIVNASAIVVPAVPVQGVIGNRRKRAQEGKGAPKSVASVHVGGVQRPGLAAEKAFLKRVRIPHVEVAHLRSRYGDDAKDATSRDEARARVARGYLEFLAL